MMKLQCDMCQAHINEIEGKKLFVNIFTMNQARMGEDIEHHTYCGKCWENIPIVINAEAMVK